MHALMIILCPQYPVTSLRQGIVHIGIFSFTAKTENENHYNTGLYLATF